MTQDKLKEILINHYKELKHTKPNNHELYYSLHNKEGFFEHLNNIINNKIGFLLDVYNRLGDGVEYEDKLSYIQQFTIESIRPTCSLCGERFILKVIDNKILFDFSETYSDNFYIRPLECKYLPIREKAKIDVNIEISSGKFVVANFINMDFDRYENDINYPLNFYKASKEYAKDDICMFEMGNMTMDVMVNDDGTEIIMCQEFGYDDKGFEFEYTYPGFKKIGYISNDMWRWMGADYHIFRSCDQKKELPELVSINQYDNTDWNPILIIDVKPGQWKVEHFYPFSNTNIYSKLTFVE